MSGFLASSWELVLSAFAPLAMACGLFALEARGPLAATIRSGRGLVAPYFTVVSIILGLFAALLVSDVWHKCNEARHAVQAEGDAVHLIAHLARANGIEAMSMPRLKTYAEAASAENPYSAAIDARRGETGKAYQELLVALSTVVGIEPPVRAALLGAARELLNAHDKRLHLANDVTAPIKWLALLVFGGITQIALMLVHVDNRRPMRVAVGLFTVAFSFCLVVVAIFDAPFEIVLSDEPGATLRLVLQGL